LASGSQEAPPRVAGLGDRRWTFVGSLDPHNTMVLKPFLRGNLGEILCVFGRVELVYGGEAEISGILSEESFCIFRAREFR
tara:strand:+ start:64 stop:306 length:243 start_codon:yes stop_codon:yes gene_type:complete